MKELISQLVDSALTGEAVDNAVDQAKGLLGTLF